MRTYFFLPPPTPLIFNYLFVRNWINDFEIIPFFLQNRSDPMKWIKLKSSGLSSKVCYLWIKKYPIVIISRH